MVKHEKNGRLRSVLGGMGMEAGFGETLKMGMQFSVAWRFGGREASWTVEDAVNVEGMMIDEKISGVSSR